MSAVPCSPAEAARQACEWRKAAGEPGLHPVTIKARLELAAEYQAMARTDYVADKHDASEATDG